MKLSAPFTKPLHVAGLAHGGTSKCIMRLLLQGALIEGYTNKVPKVVVGALDATLTILRCAYRSHTSV
jgi:hypothetical protein